MGWLSALGNANMNDKVASLLADATQSLADLVAAAEKNAAGAQVIEQALTDLVAVLEQSDNMAMVIKAITELRLTVQAPAVAVHVTPNLRATLEHDKFRPLVLKVNRLPYNNLIDTIEIVEKQ